MYNIYNLLLIIKKKLLIIFFFTNIFYLFNKVFNNKKL